MTEARDMILAGEKTCLGPRRKDLLQTYLRWINDPQVNCYLTMWGAAMSMEDEENWYEGMTGSPEHRLLTVYDRENLKPIGNTGLHQIDSRHGTAEFGIVIGEREYWGRGFGTEATRLMLDYGFTGLGLHCIRLRVFSPNERAIRCYENVGFRRAGRLREAERRGNHRFDHILMDMLHHEFESPMLHELLADEGIIET